MMRIDLNCDMGESFGAYTIGMDQEVIRYITSANIACGFHAGDPLVMNRTVGLARQHGVGVGAHPGYPDLAGFGRRNMDCTPDEIRDYLIYQISALKGFCAFHGIRMQHVKPHGSLYNSCVGNEKLSASVAKAIAAVDKDLFWVVLGGKASDTFQKIADAEGIRVAFEAFPDRAYTPDGKLAPRSLPGAVIKDPELAARQALIMAKEGKVIATDGSTLSMQVQTLCVHGDNPAALEHVKTIRRTLEGEAIRLLPMGVDV
jgi:UPF0271 protein